MSAGEVADPESARIRVEPSRREWLEALVVGDDAFSDRFGIAVVAGWVGFPEALPVVLEGTSEGDPDPWGSHLFFDTDGALVGFGGFKGAPADGAAEIGYAVAPERQGRGLATAATEIMIERARTAGVRLVFAHTLGEPNASTAVLTRCGFTRVATLVDDDLGREVWRWELPLQQR
jgi:RimJ/RimL family protein N-acetyltransferase